MHGTTVLAAAHDDLQIHALELEQIHALISDDSADEVKQLFREMEAEESELDDESAVGPSAHDDEEAAPAVEETPSASQDPSSAESEASKSLEEKTEELSAEETLGLSPQAVNSEATIDVEVALEGFESAPKVSIDTRSDVVNLPEEAPPSEVLKTTREELDGASAASTLSEGEAMAAPPVSRAPIEPAQAAAAIDVKETTTVVISTPTSPHETLVSNSNSEASVVDYSDITFEHTKTPLESAAMPVSESAIAAETDGASSNESLGDKVEGSARNGAEQLGGNIAANGTTTDQLSGESKTNEDTAMAKAAATITIPGLVESEAEAGELEASKVGKVVAADELLLNVSDLHSGADTKVETQSAVGSLLPSRLKALGRFMSGHTQSSDPVQAVHTNDAAENPTAIISNETNATAIVIHSSIVSSNATSSLPLEGTLTKDSDKGESYPTETSAMSSEVSTDDDERTAAPLPLVETTVAALFEPVVELSSGQEPKQEIGAASAGNTTVALEASPLLDTSKAKTAIEVPLVNYEEASTTGKIASKHNEGAPAELNESSSREEQAKSCVSQENANPEVDTSSVAGALNGVTDATNVSRPPPGHPIHSNVNHTTAISSEFDTKKLPKGTLALNSTSAVIEPSLSVADTKLSTSPTSTTAPMTASSNASAADLTAAKSADSNVIAATADAYSIPNATAPTIPAATTIATNVPPPATQSDAVKPTVLTNKTNAAAAAAIKTTDLAEVLHKITDTTAIQNKTTAAPVVPNKTNSTTAIPNKTAAPAKTLPSNGEKASLDKKLDKCMEGLNFTKFKGKVQAKVAAAKAAANGANGVGAAAAASLQQDRIFKTMMDMIKTVEINSSILELYLVKLHTCYSSVLEDVKQERDAALLAMRQDLEQHTPAGHTLHREMAAVELRVTAGEQYGWSLLMAAVAACTMALLLSLAACGLVLRQRLELKALRQPVSPQHPVEQPQLMRGGSTSNSDQAAHRIASPGPGKACLQDFRDAIGPSPRREGPSSYRISSELKGSTGANFEELSVSGAPIGDSSLPCASMNEQKEQTRGGPGYG